VVNNAYARKLVSDEFRELLMFAGLASDYHCKTKVVDGKNTYYSFETKIGECRVVSPKIIYVKDQKFKSLREARLEIYRYL
jgi:hypothetical protein